MPKYYIASGDLRKIISTSMSAKMAAKKALEDFIEQNKGDKSQSVAPSIGVSQRGFREPNSKIQYKFDDAVYYNVVDVVDTI